MTLGVGAPWVAPLATRCGGTSSRIRNMRCPIHNARNAPTAFRPPFEAWDFQRAGFISMSRLQENTVPIINFLSFDPIEVGSQRRAARVSTASRSAASFLHPIWGLQGRCQVFGSGLCVALIFANCMTARTCRVGGSGPGHAGGAETQWDQKINRILIS